MAQPGTGNAGGRPAVAERFAAAGCDRRPHHPWRCAGVGTFVRVGGYAAEPRGTACRGSPGLLMTALAISNVVLWVLVVVLACVVLALVRQVGVLHERLAPAGALMLNRGLAVGQPAPQVEVADLQGRTQKVGGARADGRSTLLLFVSPSCPVCKSVLTAVKSSRKDERAWLDVIL